MYIGKIYIPSGAGVEIGEFQFTLSEIAKEIEIGNFVTAETSEGNVVGIVSSMKTIGIDNDPILASLDIKGSASREVILVSALVVYSKTLRSIRSGQVRLSTSSEIQLSTNLSKNNWPIPAGAVNNLGEYTPIYLDGYSLLGPESAHINVGGLSGQATKSSYISFLIKSVLSHSNNNKISFLVFNVKGDDFTNMDKITQKSLSEEDYYLYKNLNIDPTPYSNFNLFAPAMKGNENIANSSRDDAKPICWDLRTIWPNIKNFLGENLYSDEKVVSFLSDFANDYIYTTNPAKRISSFEEIDFWFNNLLKNDDNNEQSIVWKSHHRATLWRIRRMFNGLLLKSQGLITNKPNINHGVSHNDFKEGSVNVIDISMLSPDIQAIVMGKIINDLLRKFNNSEINIDNLVIVADELNTFAPSVSSEFNNIKKLLHNLSTQGRYAGISLWGAAQKLSKIDEHIRDNAATRAVGLLSEGELNSGAYGNFPRGTKEKITKMERGELMISHTLFRNPITIRFPKPAWSMGMKKNITNSKLNNDFQDLDEVILDELLITNNGEDLNTKFNKTFNNIDKLLKERNNFDPDNPFRI